MERYVIREIAHLGKVKFDSRVSVAVIYAALEYAEQAAANDKAAVFTNHVLTAMIVDPPKTSAEVADLPENVMSALVKVAAGLLGIQEDFEKTLPDLAARERFYQAYFGWFDRTIGSAVRGIAQQTQAMMLNAFTPFEFNVPVPIIEIPVPRIEIDYETVLAPFIESLQASRDALFTQMRESLQDINERFVQLGKVVKQRLDAAELDAQVAGPLLAQANLWIPPSASLDLLRALRELAEGEDATPEAVEELFLEYFGDDEWAALREMVSSWEGNPHFEDRMPIMSDALQAHINGRFTLSVPTLLPHVEGITSNILGMSVSHGTGSQVRGLLEREFPEYFSSASKDILIEFVTNVVYTGTDFNNFAADLQSRGLVETDFLNRHAILHGVHVNYANEGLSLRAFLLLDALSLFSTPPPVPGSTRPSPEPGAIAPYQS
ncbi:MAG: hypothetical protein IMY86_08825, partial [Chloroflexi bacterium]|nr:hypothetical protein [Chloroflexota bacterium]